MKKFNFILISIITGLCLVSCGGAETKADPKTDTYNKEGNADEKIPEVTTAAPAAKADSSAVVPDSNEILAKIDKYLVSTPVNGTGGGISNATVTIKNTLSNITFQKVIVEVNILSADGKVIKNDFYPIQNIEPGDVETIKIPNNAKGVSLLSHVIKVKSNELTNGETVMVGTLFEASK